MPDPLGPIECEVRNILAKGLPLRGQPENMRQNVDYTLAEAFVFLAKEIDGLKRNVPSHVAIEDYRKMLTTIDPRQFDAELNGQFPPEDES